MDFVRRGLIGCGFGPLVLAVLYLIMQYKDKVETLKVTEVCIAILSVSVLAFVAGGMNALYQIERLPLPVAILIHGVGLYFTYLGTYLLNGWLEQGYLPILVFSGIFVVGYLMIWAIIYMIVKRKTARLNEMLKKEQQNS